MGSAENTCTLGTKNSANSDRSNPPSKFGEQEKVWVKLDNNSYWMDGEITQVLANQSYTVKLLDGHIFRRNQHHTTRRLSCLKPRATSEAIQDVKSYNLKPRKNLKCVQWPDIPAEASTGVDFKLPDEL